MCKLSRFYIINASDKPIRRPPIVQKLTAGLLIAWAASFILLGTLWSGCRRPAAPPAASPPNIILIITDDQRWDEVHLIPGTTVTAMPIVESRLLDNGVEFTNSFVTTSLCCPNRATILTGLYAFHHGVLDNRAPHGGATVFNDSTTLATRLQEAGYQTALVGKYLNDYELMAPRVPPGWNRWAVFAGARLHPKYYHYQLTNEAGNSLRYGSLASDYSSDVLTQKAIAFITKASSDKVPFFLEVSYYAPHIPAVPARRHSGLLSDLPPIHSPSFNEENMKDKIGWLRKLPPLTDSQIRLIDERRTRIFETLLAVDEGVEAIMDRLQALMIADNTVVFFTSDNGYVHGEHRLFKGKRCPYEECLRVPLIIRAPMFISSPQHDSRMVLSMDLFPTILELAGTSVPREIDGKSLLPLLQGSSEDLRSDFLFENWHFYPEGGNYFPTNVGIRTTRWVYAEFPRTGEEELYNLERDPYELQNVAGDPAHAALIESFSKQIKMIRSR